MAFVTRALRPSVNRLSVRNFSLLRDRLEELVPIKRAELTELKKTHGDKQIGTCTVDQAIGGMRGVKSMIWETSLLDAGM